MRYPSPGFGLLAALSALVAAAATSLPGLGLVLWSPSILGAFALGILLLVLARDRAFRAPKTALPRLLRVTVAVAIGVSAGGLIGLLARDRIFWYYAPAYEAAIQRMVADDRTGLLPTAELPPVARFCCRSAPTVYRDQEGPDVAMTIGYFEVTADDQYQYELPAEPASRTEYYGAAPDGARVLPSARSDVGHGVCDPVELHAQWCRVSIGSFH